MGWVGVSTKLVTQSDVRRQSSPAWKGCVLSEQRVGCGPFRGRLTPPPRKEPQPTRRSEAKANPWRLDPRRERPGAAAPLRRGGARHVVLAGSWAAV